jgi:vesicle-associated membrane protein 72
MHVLFLTIIHTRYLQAQDFRQQGTKVRRKMWLQNMKIKLIVLGIIIALILIIILSVCHGFNCGKK